MLAEQVGMHGRDQAQVRSEIERLLEARIMGVAQLVRADSEALRALIEERTDVQVDTIRETVDWRMAAFAERMDEKLGSVAGDVAVTVTESVTETVASTVATTVSATVSETVAAAVSGTVADALADTVAGRAAEAAEMAIASSLGATVERMNAGVGAIDGIDSMLAEGQAAVEERLRAHIDDRMTAIARLIRSDNQALASTVREQQTIVPSETLDAELVRQTLRAIKELQAGLADDVQSNVDVQIRSISDQLHKETQSTTESMVKVAEVLGEKIDRLTVRVDEGVGNDMQVVIDRMSDAIQAMSSARRSA